MSIHIVGSCSRRIFGLTPAERLSRQRTGPSEGLLVVHASAVLGDSAIAWLQRNPGLLLTGKGGRGLAVHVPTDAQAEGEKLLGQAHLHGRRVNAEQAEEMFNRKLRRRESPFVMSVEDHSQLEVERALFASVYKGVTDLVTKWVWPEIAFWITRVLARWRVHPNAVTVTGMLLMLLATFLFYRGALAQGLAAAWAMTLLDTVDGKLARVTATSSRLGNILDHGTDLLHPPLWWACLAIGLIGNGAPQDLIVSACAIILSTYVLGRIAETTFKARLGFNQFLWQPFDSVFRLVVVRRNTILLIMTIGLLLGRPDAAFLVSALWGVISTVIQLVRLFQAWSRRPVQPWME